MAGDSIKGISLIIDGSTEPLSKALGGINKTSKDLQSELSAVNKLLKFSPDSSILLTQKQKLLSDSVSTTKTKLDTLKLAEAQAQEQFKKGKISEEQYRNLQREVVKTESSLKGLESQALKAQAVLSKDQATNNLKNIGKAALVAGAAVGAAFVTIGMKAMESADELQKQADITGLSTERLQELKYAGAQLGVELETITGAQAKLTKAMTAAKDETKGTGLAFKTLGVEVRDSNGNMRDSKTVMSEAFTALNNVGNETERDSLAMQIFGKSGMALNPIIKAGGDELNRLTKEARDTGAVMSNEAVAGLDKFGDTMDSLGQSIMGTVGEKLAKYTPQILDLTNKLMGLPKWVEKNSAVFKVMGIGIGVVTVSYIAFNVQQLLLASGLIATGVAGAGAIAVINGLKIAFAFATGPVGLLILGLGAVSVAALLLTDASNKATEKIKTLAKSCNDSSKTFDTQTGAIKADAAMAKKWADELYVLEGKQKRTNTETARMSLLVGQLNKIMPNLNLAINTQTGALNMNEAAVLSNVKAMKEQALAMAYVARVTELYKEKIVLEEQSVGVQARLTAATIAAQKAWDGGWTPAIIKSRIELNSAKEASDLLAGSQEKNAKSTKFVEGAYTAMAVSVADSNKKITDSAGKTTELTAEELKQQESDVKARNSAIESSTSEHLSQMGGIESKGIEQTKLTAKQFLKNLQQQVADMQNWREQLKILAGKGYTDFYNEMEKLGPSSASLLKELNKLSVPELDKYVQLNRQKFGLAYDAAVGEVDGLPGAVKTIGANAGQSFANGINLKTGVVTTAAGRLANAAKPSVSLYASGANAVQSYADGINSRLSAVKKASQNVANSVTGQISHYMEQHSPSQVMIRMGAQGTESYAMGLTKNISMVVKAARGIAESTKNAIKGLSADVNLGMNLGTGTNGLGTSNSSVTTSKVVNLNVDKMIMQNQGDKNANLAQFQYLTAW